MGKRWTKGYMKYGWALTSRGMVIDAPCETPSGSSISKDGLLLIGWVGSPPLRLPEATKIEPFARICTDGYQRAVSSRFPGSTQSWPSKSGFSDERVRYLKPLKPLRMVGSRQASGPLPPTESSVPFARNVPPLQKALLLYASGTTSLLTGSYSEL